MKIFLISDNLDSCRGFRLAGIEGVVVESKEELMKNIDMCLKNPDIGIVLITEKLVALEYEKIYDIKLNYTKPLIVEVPSPGASFQMSDSIARYIREAIGIKI